MRSGFGSAAVAAALCILAGGGAQAALIGSFSGTVSIFNTGPFAGGTAFSATFEIDETVMGTGTGLVSFADAVDNLVVTIGSDVITGNDGRLQQFNNAAVTSDFVTMTFNASFGSLAGVTANNWMVTSMGFDLRGSHPYLFADQTVLTDGFDLADLSFVGINMRFDDLATPGTDESGLAGLTILNVTSFSLAPEAVAEPAALGLFGLGLAGLGAGLARRRRR
jgi:hypothetical protein